MVHSLDSSFFSRMELGIRNAFFFRSGHHATWMMTDLCKMTSIQIIFIQWIVKMRNYQFSKSKRSCCRCKKLKRLNTRPRTVNVISSFPPWDDHAIWCKKSLESVECIYILEEPCVYFMANFYESSCKNIYWLDLSYEIFQVQVGERGQRLKLWLCKWKIKKFSVPFMVIRLLNCMQKR